MFLPVAAMYYGFGGIAAVPVKSRSKKPPVSWFVLIVCAACAITAHVRLVRAEDDHSATAKKELSVTFNLDERNLAGWRDHILPDESELAFERIGWLPTFAEGIARAGAEDKPLLLWVMNGHPLGCT